MARAPARSGGGFYLGLLPVVKVTRSTVFVCRTAVESLIRSPLPWTEADAKAIFNHGRRS